MKRFRNAVGGVAILCAAAAVPALGADSKATDDGGSAYETRASELCAPLLQRLKRANSLWCQAQARANRGADEGGTERDAATRQASECQKLAATRAAEREAAVATKTRDQLLAIPAAQRLASEVARLAALDAEAVGPLRAEAEARWSARWAKLRATAPRGGGSRKSKAEAPTVRTTAVVVERPTCPKGRCASAPPVIVELADFQDPAVATCGDYVAETRRLDARIQELSPEWAGPAEPGSQRAKDIADARHKKTVNELEQQICVDAMWSEMETKLRNGGDRCWHVHAMAHRQRLREHYTDSVIFNQGPPSDALRLLWAQVRRCEEALAIMPDDEQVQREVTALADKVGQCQAARAAERTALLTFVSPEYAARHLPPVPTGYFDASARFVDGSSGPAFCDEIARSPQNALWCSEPISTQPERLKACRENYLPAYEARQSACRSIPSGL